MVSTELLRRYPFFAGLTDSQLKAVANLAQESHYPTGSTIFEECHVASHLFILLEGSVELYYRSQEEFYPTSVKEFFVGEINPGEAFGTSSMIPPYELNATARFIEINSTELLKLMAQDLELANILLLQVIKTLQDRMGSLRIQLAAAQS
jgi:CRP-like cAMP-binding protein